MTKDGLLLTQKKKRWIIVLFLEKKKCWGCHGLSWIDSILGEISIQTNQINWFYVDLDFVDQTEKFEVRLF